MDSILNYNYTASITERLTQCRVCWGLEFKFQAGQILHSVANGSPLLQHLRKLLYCLGVMSCRWAKLICYLRHRARIMKGMHLLRLYQKLSFIIHYFQSSNNLLKETVNQDFLNLLEITLAQETFCSYLNSRNCEKFVRK